MVSLLQLILEVLQMMISSTAALTGTLRHYLEWQNTHMRISIPVEKRLAITLWYLSSLEVFRKLRHQFSMGLIVKEVCLVILEELFKKKVCLGNEVGSLCASHFPANRLLAWMDAHQAWLATSISPITDALISCLNLLSNGVLVSRGQPDNPSTSPDSSLGMEGLATSISPITDALISRLKPVSSGVLVSRWQM
ncbi:UNVERIFIED_CONTAM: hypothetical protein K2H54_055169 [Gekko kuhli]